ncbi:hypothetical protein [Bradyrhizobium sp. MOS002]|uniref:hypothetical protein n=1 Tax=Bradyrhizobium sp. MOS002 TaxID=2133947 RepID=UPI000D13B1B6|nr:hypothetical protein [Bradyrhizobium sp. MOS002]PSO30123.1 hypothetical protein C7G41_22760 [Bradyrhizobium sp. MOS002]
MSERRNPKKTPKAKPKVPHGAYSIPEFCAAHGISEVLYYRLGRAGLGPRIMKVGSRTLISIEACAEWRRERETIAAK